MIVIEGKYFLYRHVRIDKNEVFYIGIGTKKYGRSFGTVYRRAVEKSARNKHWKNIIIITDYKIEILLESDNYEFILEKEKEFIKLYGRVDLKTGSLVNWTDGGMGASRLIEDSYNNVVRKKTGQKGYWKNKKRDPESVKKTADGNRGKKVSNEAKNKRLNTYSVIWGVTVLDLQGNFIKNYRNAQEASVDLNIRKETILGFLRKQRKTSKVPYIFVKTSEYDKNMIYKSKEYFSNWVPINQLDMGGNFIKEWEAVTIAGRTLGINWKNISTVAKGKRKSAGGFKWEYKDKNMSYENKKRISNINVNLW